MNATELEAKFIGFEKGMIHALRIEELKKTGQYRLWFREDQKKGQTHIDYDDYDELQKYLVKFGGKNPDTCKAQERFVDFDGTWDNKTLANLGQRVTKISLEGTATVKSDRYAVTFPENTGSPGTLQANRNTSDVTNVHNGEHKKCFVTRSFSSPLEMDNLAKHLLGEASFKNLKWKTKKLHTEQIATGKQCVWVNVLAGDGTRKRVLELQEVDGIKFFRCVRQELYDAAGDMFDQPCKRVPTGTEREAPEKNICLFALEDGKINSAGKKQKK